MQFIFAAIVSIYSERSATQIVALLPSSGHQQSDREELIPHTFRIYLLTNNLNNSCLFCFLFYLVLGQIKKNLSTLYQ